MFPILKKNPYKITLILNISSPFPAMCKAWELTMLSLNKTA